MRCCSSCSGTSRGNWHSQVRVHWQPNSLLVWDNWASQHHAIWDYYPEERWGNRVSVVTGDLPRARLDVSEAAE